MSSTMAGDVKVVSKPCMLDSEGCVSLKNILISFNAPINEEYAWALCYQCAKCFQEAFESDREKCCVVSEAEHVLLHKDGYVHANTIFAGGGQGRIKATSETKMLFCLGSVIWNALDYGLQEFEEKRLSPELDALIDVMTSAGEDTPSTHHETDDEGIERDSGEADDDSASSSSAGHAVTFNLVLRLCAERLGKRSGTQADGHYRAVVRALVAEALDLSSFLQKVSQGTGDLQSKTETTSKELDKLQFSDWTRLWVQVIHELRNGVKLKKVDYSRTPIEFEMTPYEILMDDIRSRRYKLNKVMVDGDIPHRVKKDAHAIILEFIRSRPPLKKASERKLRPAVSRPSTPREALMDSIKQGRPLKPSFSPLKKRVVPADGPVSSHEESGSQPTQTRRLIQVDFSVFQSDDDDDEPLDITSHKHQGKESGAFVRTAYDLATQCPTRRASVRRHNLVSCDVDRGAASVPQSRPQSRQSDVSRSSGGEELAQLGATNPEMSWSRTSLQEEFFQSKSWAQECLSLTLEEIVHIRSVLTKAELEALPVDGHVKEDVEKRKVCFLCLKTRFTIWSWGQKCRLCKRTVCPKCLSKMRIPTEHFSHVPVVALSPSLLNSPDEEDTFPRALASRLGVPESRNSVGSAPSSPQLSRESASAPGSRAMSRIGAHNDGALSLPPASPSSTASDRRSRMSRSTTLGRADRKAEKLKGMEMTVCHDCKAMVIQIIKSSRTTRNNAIRNLTLNLSPVY